ncbi:Telomeric repeat-binding factor 1 [Rhynchospora pubera]|uniref:Telomeric repeat-binding factor 1 n=1 Tax=Rhynchospora pubera TaxID=906938 RepID=A0AAV8CMB5_9POAL|nr:Telomeric repeat-binding factor 1 [Rhynchospora pubera]
MADSTTAYWMLEFVLRQRTLPDSLINALVLALWPSSSSSSAAAPLSLRRAILFRRLSSDLSSRRFTPHSLRLIELLQSLDPRPNSLASNAYVSVARYLVTSAPDFDSAVALVLHRIGAIMRSPDASGLASDWMKRASEEMEKALTDSDLRGEVVSRKALKEAMESVEVFLEMEWQPCYLETFAKKTSAKGKPGFIPKTIPSPEVKKQVEDLRSSCAELLNMVEDPLPEAIKFANEVAESLRGKVGEDIQDMPVDQNSRDDGGDAISTGLPKRSLMDHNPTAFHYEWSETSDSSEGGSRRFRLATPRRIPVSPLRKGADRKLGGIRRKVKRWSVLEEDTLRKAVEECGRGNWKMMLHKYRHIFEERTEVDLKDKWRNMTRF